MSFKAAVHTNPKEPRERRTVGGGKSLKEAQGVASSYLADNPAATAVTIVDANGAEVETVTREEKKP